MVRSAGSLHERVRSALSQEIQDGIYDEAGRIPTEPELCERFGVSRVTVRRAVSDLEVMGLVRRQQGAGTFVTRRRDTPGTMTIGGFSDMFLGEHVPSRDIKTAEIAQADAATAALLRIEPGASVFLLERVFGLDGVPHSLDRSVYSLDKYPGFAEKISPGTSTYQVLRDEYGVRFGEVRREIRIGFTNATTAAWLDLPENEPLLVMEKVAIDQEGSVIHTSHVETVPSRMTLRVTAHE